MLELRVSRIEDDLKEIKSDLKGMRVDLTNIADRNARVEGAVSKLPGWPGLLTVAGVVVAAVGVMLRFLPVANP